MQRLLIVLLGVGLLLGAAVPASASESETPIRLAYVDLQRALLEVEDGRRAMAELQRDFERRQRELETAQNELQQFAEELEARFEMLSEQARMEQAQEYQQRAMALQASFQSHQRELAEAEARATRDIFERMVTIVREVAQEREYTMVIEKNEASVLYAIDGLEFTDELVRRYNARHN